METKTGSEAKMAFVSFCIEEYKAENGMTGADVVALFEKYGVTDFLIGHFDILHSLDRDMILDDIDRFMAARRRKK